MTEKKQERKEDLRLREQRGNGIWELKNGEKERFWGPRIEATRDWGLSHIKWGVICLIEVFVSLEGDLG